MARLKNIDVIRNLIKSDVSCWIYISSEEAEKLVTALGDDVLVTQYDSDDVDASKPLMIIINSSRNIDNESEDLDQIQIISKFKTLNNSTEKSVVFVLCTDYINDRISLGLDIPSAYVDHANILNLPMISIEDYNG